jgi:uncharacterized membrane protein
MRQSNADFSEQDRLPFGSTTVWLGASALMLYGLTRRSKLGFALAGAGGVLALKAASSKKSPQLARATFLISAPMEKTYQLWRRFEDLPRFMVHLQAVQVLDSTRSVWLARGPLNREVRWEAEITQDLPGKRIAWRSLPNSDIQTNGSVEFRADPQNRGTYVTAQIHYWSPAGAMGNAITTLWGRHPQFTVREDLRRFKAWVETGETPTIVGQTHGPRGVHGKVEKVLFRETTNQPQPQAA